MSKLPPIKRRWPLGIAGFLSLMISVGLWWRHPLPLAGGLLMASMILFLLLRTRQAVICYLVGFILGPIAEYFAVSLGAWTYWIPRGGAILPLWLPFGWGIASVTLWSVMVELAVQETSELEGVDLSAFRRDRHRHPGTY